MGPADMKRGRGVRKHLVSVKAMENSKCCNTEHKGNLYVAGVVV